MTRVLLVTQPVDGGVFRHVSDLAAGLARRGFDVVVAAPAAAATSALEAEVVPVAMVRSVAPAADARSLAALARVVRRVRPDVVHAHSSKAGAVVRLARPVAPRVPVLYTPHGYAFAGHFAGAERRRYRALERALAPLASRVVCVCEAERRLASSVGPARRTRVVHNGVALPAATVGPPVGSVVAALTQLRPGKGLETLIDAMPAVRAAHPDARAVIVGDGPERDGLAARVAALGLDGVVELVGYPDDPLGALARVDVFVHPSWAEALPYAVLDAMALGLPVVASDVGGIGEAVQDGVSGVLVPPADPAGLAAALSALLGDRSRAQALGAAARRRVGEAFTVDAMVDGTVRIYEEVLS